MDPVTVVVRLELRVTETSLTGCASTARAPAREFAGWLGLVAAIDGLIAGRGSSAEPMTRSPTPEWDNNHHEGDSMFHAAKARRPRGGRRLAVLARRMALVVGMLAALATFTSSASASASSVSPFVFVANGGGTVSQFDVGAGGLLSANTPPNVPAGDGTVNVAVSPDGRSVYVTNEVGNSISQYDVGPDGALTPKNPATVATDAPIGVAVSPDGRSVYVTNANGGNVGSVSQYDVGTGGVLSPKTPATVATGEAPVAVAVSPDGSSVYVANLDSNSVSQFDVDPASGALSPKTPAAVGAGDEPNSVAVSPDGGSVYVTNSDDNSVSQFDVDSASGALSPKTPAAVGAGDEPNSVAVSPDGSSVYVANTANSVSQFDVSTGGTLSPKNPATVTSDYLPAGVVVSPDGKSVYVTDGFTNAVSQFDVGAGGVLAPKSPATVAAGSGPAGIAETPAPFVLGVNPATGPITGGTEVTITGTGFRQGDSVEIGQGSGAGASAISAASVTVVSPTKIIAVTGGSAKQGTYNLFVVDPGGAVSAPDRFDRFTYTGGPVVSQVTPGSGPVTGQTGIEILGSGFTKDATVEIGQGSGASASAIPAFDVDVVDSSEIVAGTGGPALAGKWNVFVVASGGTSAASSADVFTYTGPSVSGVSPASGPVSGGTTVTITGTGFAPGATVEIGQGDGAGAGAIPAAVSQITPTQITATTGGGAQAGTFNVFVTGSDATSRANATDRYTYTPATASKPAGR